MLKTASQAHINWCFGGIAELVDNGHDSGAKYMHIDLKATSVMKQPTLIVSDNGTGMTFAEVLTVDTTLTDSFICYLLVPCLVDAFFHLQFFYRR
jgi:DNA mismatch repair ATPase MutL